MRALLGVLSLLLVLAIVALLVKKQMAPVLVAPMAVDGGLSLPAPAPGATQQQQSQQIQQQFRKDLENALQQPRPMPDDK